MYLAFSQDMISFPDAPSTITSATLQPLNITDVEVFQRRAIVYWTGLEPYDVTECELTYQVDSLCTSMLKCITYITCINMQVVPKQF